MRKIQFFDTTLRDGEQTPGVNFNTKEKVQLALQLENGGSIRSKQVFRLHQKETFKQSKRLLGR